METGSAASSTLPDIGMVKTRVGFRIAQAGVSVHMWQATMRNQHDVCVHWGSSSGVVMKDVSTGDAIAWLWWVEEVVAPRKEDEG